MITPSRIQHALGQQSSQRESEGGGNEDAHLPSPPTEPVLFPFFPELPFELVERILWFLIEIPGMAAIVARVGRFSYRRAVMKIYTVITIYGNTRHEVLASALTGNERLALLVKSIVFEIYTRSRDFRSRRTESIDAVLKAVAPSLENLHIVHHFGDILHLEYEGLNLRSLLLYKGLQLPSTLTSWTKLTHVITGNPTQVLPFTSQQFPSLTHMATLLLDLNIWEESKRAFTWLLQRNSASLRFLVVVVGYRIELSDISDIYDIVPDHIQLITLLLPDCFQPYCEIMVWDLRTIQTRLHRAHLAGSLWDVKRCTTDVIFSGLRNAFDKM
ncbi:hypothetical protein JAAARDRAFT_209424 [Jaapia argillacea MUCL 33604]|uniref:F-box domain-containing protein n=1 Tax=Jaapia argillacea MUCL 33604 TaxID=933084 RepID=A0A067PKC4_9AGAM|nr:hypothetical protein JAAARDRAFT_209424 [Jaapia argillacea MUCL 33604]